MADEITNKRPKAYGFLLIGAAWIALGILKATAENADHNLHWWWILFTIAAIGIGVFFVLLGLLVLRGRTVLFVIRSPRRR